MKLRYTNNFELLTAKELAPYKKYRVVEIGSTIESCVPLAVGDICRIVDSHSGCLNILRTAKQYYFERYGNTLFEEVID